MNYCYLNGEILLYKDCNLHISDLLIQRGYGVFDFFRCRNGIIPWLDDYTERLFSSLQLAGIEVGLTRQEFTSVVYELQAKNGDEDGAFKVIVTGGYSNNLETVTRTSNVIILNVPYQSPPTETIEKGVNLISCEYLRPNAEIKTLNYFNTLKLQNKMQEYNAVDVLYYTDLITECSRANVFFVTRGRIHSPQRNILQGITRKQILHLFPDIIVEDIHIDRLYDFDEMFITSTSRDVTPVVSVEGRKIGNGKPGKVTGEVIAALFNLIKTTQS